MSNNYRKGRQIRRGRYRFDQAVVQGIALGGSAQTHHSHSPVHFQIDALRGRTVQDGLVQIRHGVSLQRLDQEANKVIIDNHIVSRSPDITSWWFP